MSVSKRILDDLFSQKFDVAEEEEIREQIKKIEYAGTYIRDRLQSVEYSRKIIPPKYTGHVKRWRRTIPGHALTVVQCWIRRMCFRVSLFVMDVFDWLATRWRGLRKK